MAVVTDKKYYLDDSIIRMCGLALERRRMKWDNLWIYDGDEGSGKTTFAVAHCHYLAQQLGIEFNVKDHIYFDLDKMMDYAAKNEGKVILWDEAALGGLSTQHMSKTQAKLVQALMVARKKRHIWVFCIPKFYELRAYVVRRSIGLVHVYSPDGKNRGYFTYYKKDAKQRVYNSIKTSKVRDEYPYKKYYTFRGKFTDYTRKEIIDWDSYEDKKDKAILDSFSNTNIKSRNQEKLIILKHCIAKIAKDRGITQEVIGDLTGNSRNTVSDWLNLDKKYPNLLEKLPFYRLSGAGNYKQGGNNEPQHQIKINP